MDDIDKRAGAKALLADRLLMEILDELEQEQIDRAVGFKPASQNDIDRNLCLNAVRVLRDLRGTLEQLARDPEQPEEGGFV